MKKTIGLLLILGFVALQLNAQQTLSLDEAINTGLEKNYGIRVSLLQEEVAEWDLGLATAGGLPIITLGLRQSNRFDDNTTSVRSHGFTPNVNLNWTLFGGFSAQIRKDNYDRIYELSQGNTAILVENSIQAISLAWYNILLQKKQLEVLTELMDLSGDRYAYFQHKKELGGAVTYDVLQAKIAYLSDSSNYIQQKYFLKRANRTLSLLLADSTGNLYSADGQLESPAFDFSEDSLINALFSSNRSLRNKYINQKILENNIGLSKSQLYPWLSLNAGADYSESYSKPKNVDGSWSDALGVYATFSLSYTLYNGGNIRGAIEQEILKEAAGLIQITEMRHSLRLQMLNQLDLYNNRKELLNVARERLESAKLNLEISEQKYRSGAINSFNFRDVQLTYLNAAIAELQSRYNLIESHLELMRLSGGLLTEN